MHGVQAFAVAASSLVLGFVEDKGLQLLEISEYFHDESFPVYKRLSRQRVIHEI